MGFAGENNRDQGGSHMPGNKPKRLRRMPAMLLLALYPTLALAADAPCRTSHLPDLPPLEGCSQTVPGTLAISAASLAALEFDMDGLAVILVQGQFYYLRPDGHYLPVITFDNGADYFSEGLVRAVIDGKLGYYDITLQPAFGARFDWGWPFENGSALVCDGCRRGTPDTDGHTPMVGGRFFRIDRQGKPLPDSP